MIRNSIAKIPLQNKQNVLKRDPKWKINYVQISYSAAGASAFASSAEASPSAFS